MKVMLLAVLAIAPFTVFAAPGSVTTELMGFETIKVDGQEIRVAVTKETTFDGKTAFCRQYVESFKHEESVAMGPQTTVVLGKSCRENKNG